MLGDYYNNDGNTGRKLYLPVL